MCVMLQRRRVIIRAEGFFIDNNNNIGPKQRRLESNVAKPDRRVKTIPRNFNFSPIDCGQRISRHDRVHQSTYFDLC